jgi:hypothetical protein
MAKRKGRRGGFSMEEDRRFIAMAMNGATSTELAAEFRSTVPTIAQGRTVWDSACRDQAEGEEMNSNGAT